MERGRKLMIPLVRWHCAMSSIQRITWKVFPNKQPLDMTSQWLRWTCSKFPTLLTLPTREQQNGQPELCSQCLYMMNNWAQHEHRSSSAVFSSFMARQQRNARPKMTIIGNLPPLTLIPVCFLQGQHDSKALCHLTALLWRSKVRLHHLVWNESTWWHKT